MMAWARFRAWPWWAQALVWFVAWPVPLVLFTVSRPAPDRRKWWAITACLLTAAIAIGVSSEATDSTETVSAADATSTTSETTTSELATTSTTERHASPTTLAESPEGGYRISQVETVDVDGEDQLVRTPEANALLDTLAALPVEAEHARSGYDRALFPHWDDEDGDGCDTRCEVLSAQRQANGSWLSEWDGYSTDDTSELHVDHVVALAEAWDSGADRWSPAQRDEFADSMPNLLTVTAASNQAKGDDDAAEWFPSRAEANCLWASTVVRVKSSWALSVDQAEQDALANLLRTCGDYRPPTTTTTQPPTTAPPPTAVPTTRPAVSCTPGYSPCIPPGDDVDCAGGSGNGPRYVTGPVYVDHAYGDPYGLDGNDNDGIGCES